MNKLNTNFVNFALSYSDSWYLFQYNYDKLVESYNILQNPQDEKDVDFIPNRKIKMIHHEQSFILVKNVHVTLFNFLNSFATLIDHTRAILQEYPELNEKFTEYRDREICSYIHLIQIFKKLRNKFTHNKNFITTYHTHGTWYELDNVILYKYPILITKTDLLDLDLNQSEKKFIQTLDDDIDVMELMEICFLIMKNQYNWLNQNSNQYIINS